VTDVLDGPEPEVGDDHDGVLGPEPSGAGDGDGLGLAIVERVAVARGWDLRTVEGEDGEGRIEIDGVERL
jgi:hypothetical protein